MDEHDDLTFRDLFVPFTDRKAIAALIFAGWAVFFFSLFNGFAWDDKTYIIYNPAIATASFRDFFTPNLFNAGGQYRPLPYLYFSLLYRLFGAAPFGYHFLQVAIHMVNACLVFSVFRRFFGRNTSLFLGLIFLFHPLQVESVAYVAATGSPLFLLFGLLALRLSMVRKVGVGRIMAVGILLFLSFLARETGLLFIPVILLYRFLFIRKDVLRLAAAAVSALISYVIIRFAVGHAYLSQAQVLVPIAKLNLGQRLLNMPAIFFYYLKSFVYPRDIAIAQLWTVKRATVPDFWLPLLADTVFVILVVLTGWNVYRKKRPLFPTFIFFALWFFMAIGLHLQIVPLDWTVSDRWFYLPVIGLLGMIGAGLYLWRPGRRTGFLMAGIILAALSVRTVVRCHDWRSAIALYTHDSTIADNYDIENNLGGEYGIFNADYKNALIHYKKSVDFYPYDGNTYNLAYMYEETGDMESAKKYFYRSLTYAETAIDRGNVLRTYQHIGQILVLYGDAAEAGTFLENAIREYPQNATLRIELAVARYKLHDRAGALQEAEKAAHLSPEASIAYTYKQIKAGEPVVFVVKDRTITVTD